MRNKKILYSILFTVCCSLLFSLLYYFFWYQPPADENTFREEYALVLKDYDGNDVRLSEFRREFLVVYAWASWCPYCGDEIRNLSSLKQRYGDKITILAVNRAEPLVEAKDYSDKLGDIVGVTFLLDPSDTLYKKVEGYAMPETLFIKSNGEILFHQRGPIELQAVKDKIDELLGKNK